MNHEQDLLTAIWARLSRSEPRKNNANGANKIAVEIASSGHCERSELEDMLEAFDSRFYDFDVWALADYLDIPRQTRFRKPRFLNAMNVGGEGITATDTAGILIFLEKIGFSVEPKILVEAVLPLVQSKSYLTGCELDILRYPSQNGRHHIELRCSKAGPGQLSEQSLRTSRGIRIETILSDGKPYLLVASGPRYRRRPPPQMHRCEYCGYEYLRGDPEENAAHRSYHAEVRRIVDPWPKKQFVKALETESDAELVQAHSPMWKHHEVFQRARQFRREMKFDFIQWGKATHQDTDPQVHGFLFNDTSGTFPHGSIVGGCCFRRRQDYWELDWIWISPKVRRKGILSSRWQVLLSRFGNFIIAAPVSDAMQSFVRRHGTPAQRAALA